jgi:CRP/FNR family transcriptional regulator, cyclic AMP receptor protein
VRTEQAVSLLTKTQLLGALDAGALVPLADKALERVYRRGQLVFHQGDLGDALFIVTEGLVKVFVTSEEGEEMVLVTLRPPETFGELAVIDGGPRSASAQALEDTHVLVVTRATLLEALHEQPSLAEALLRSLGAVVRRLTEQASDLVFLDLHGRVAKLLLALAQERGEARGDAIVLDLHLTQSDLAGMVGGSRQSVNQILRAFERRGYLVFHHRQVVIRRPDLLRRRAAP